MRISVEMFFRNHRSRPFGAQPCIWGADLTAQKALLDALNVTRLLS